MTPGLGVVCLEDDIVDAALARSTLESAHGPLRWQTVFDEAHFRGALELSPPDLILADIACPTLDGLSALAIAQQLCPATPFIFLSSVVSEDVVIDALKHGATDWVLKSRMSQLAPAVDRALREVNQGTQRDVSQRALDSQRQMLEGILDAIPDFLYVVDRAGRLTLGNAAFTNTRSDRSLDAVLGRTMPEIFPRGDLGVAIAADNDLLFARNRGYQDRERLWITESGELRWYSVTKVLLHSAGDGSITGLVSLIRDITERKKLERSVLEVSEREQRRIGSDLHDGLGQELTGASLLLKSLETEIAHDSPQHVAQIHHVYQLLLTAITSMRSLARGLAPVDLESAGLPAALKVFLKGQEELTAIRCRLDITGDPEPLIELTRATHVFRIAQEAVSNAARHGGARNINVGLDVERDILLTVTDDGVGFDALATASTPGMGLRLMRYRASLLGGSINITSAATGTRMECHCPNGAMSSFAGAA